MFEIKNYTKSKTFNTENEARGFMKQHENDCDLLHWKFNNSLDLWIVYYEANGLFVYEEV